MGVKFTIIGFSIWSNWQSLHVIETYPITVSGKDCKQTDSLYKYIGSTPAQLSSQWKQSQKFCT